MTSMTAEALDTQVAPMVAPARRLAAFRILLGVFVTCYLLIRVEVFVELGDRASRRFEPAGVFHAIGRPIPNPLNTAVVACVVLAGCCFTAGWRYRLSGPIFAVGVLALTSHRSSWGQLLHFENLMTLQVLLIGLTFAAADAWSLDARRHPRALTPDGAPSARYGWPLRLASVITVATYVIAGFAKLRYGGIEWITADTLRNHIAYSATRLELLGAAPPPLASLAVETPAILRPAAGLGVLVELAAPIALVGRRWRNAWVLSAWLMHVSIYATMLVGFPSPLFGVAFAPMFRLERIAELRPLRPRSADAGDTVGNVGPSRPAEVDPRSDR